MNIGMSASGIAAISACVAIAFAQPTALVPPENGPRRVDTGWHSLWNAMVHVKPGEVLEHATVVIRDGKIEAVLKGEGDAAGPKPMGPRIWDCTGLHVYAGFIDPYVEVEVPRPPREEAGAHWNARVTPQRKAIDSNGPDEATRQTLRSLGFVAAGISPRAGIFRGTGAVVSLRKPAETAAGSPPAVYVGSAFHALGFDQQDESRELEAIWGGYPNSQMGAIAVVRQTLLDSQWQAEARKRGEAIAPNCVDVLAKGSAPEMMLFDAQDELDVLRIAKIAKEFDRKMVVVGAGTEYQRYAPIAQDGLFLIEPLRYPKAPEVGTPGEQEAIELKTMMEWEAAPFNLSRLENAGIKCCVTTARLKDRKQFDDALRLAMKAGITADVALAMVTTRPAALMGVAGQLGTIETGKIASMMVTDQDYFATGPGTGPAAAVKKWKPAKVRDVWIDGVRHEITPRPEQELAGSWDVKLVGAPGQRTLEIGAGNEIKVTKMWEDAATNKEHAKARETKAEKVLLDNGRLTFQFDHEPLGDPGVFVMSAMVRDGGMVGVGTRSDGKVFQWSAARKAPALKGSWAVVYDNNAAAPETLVFDAENQLQVLDSAGKSSTPTNVKFNGGQLSYTLIEPGITRGVLAEAELEAEETPRVLKGVTITGDTRTQWTATESLPTGTWRVFEADGQPRDVGLETGLWIVITDNSLTLRFVRDKKEGDTGPGKFKTVTIKAEDFKVDGTTITFKHDFKALGSDGTSTDTATIRGNELIGESTLQDGSKHTYKARRDVKAEPYEDKDAWRIANTPTKLPVPFGPYGLLSYPAAKNVIVTGATIWTSSNAGVIEGGTLIVRDGKISAVLKAGVEIPAGVGGEGWTLIDGKGKHVTAGIIDCHSHTGISRGVNESGEAITAEVRIEDVTNPDSINWYRQLGGGVTTVNSLHGSANAIGGQNCVNKIRWGAARPDDMHFAGAIPGIKFALGENPKGSNGSRNSTRYPQSRMGVETLIRDRFIAADEYRKAKAAGTMIRTDLELEPLAQVLDGTRLVHAHSYRQDEIVMLAMVAKDFGFKIGTYQHILEGYKVAEVIREHAIGASGFADWWAYKVEVQDAIPQGLPLMSKQGVNVSFNSDSDEMARRLNIEAGKGVKYGGLTEVEALKFITINPAIQLKIDAKVGSLEAGKDADFVIWSRAPLSGLAKCEATYIDGAEMFSLARDAEAREEIKRERSRLIQKLLVGAKKKDKKDGDEPETNKKADPKLRDHYAELMRGGHYPGSNLPGECGCGE